MYTQLPQTSEEFESLRWADIEPWYQELTSTDLSTETLAPWLAQWSQLGALVDETRTRNEIECTRNTADQERAERQQRFLNEVNAPAQPYEQQLKQKLLESGLEVENFVGPMRNLRAEASIFNEANLPLLNEEQSLATEYLRVKGEQTVQWEGEEKSAASLHPVLLEHDRDRREQAWRTVSERQIADRETLNTLWTKNFQLRQEIARNAGYENYRDYRWLQVHRFDYTPEDCKAFLAAIEQVIVPAASKLWEKRRQKLGVETIRPWDTNVNPYEEVAPRLVTDIDEMLRQFQKLFQHIDPELGSYFETMIQEQLFDLDDRPSKAPGGYNLPYEVKRLPFIFGRVTSLTDAIDLICHEAGHAFHVFEMRQLPYLEQHREHSLPAEFAEVASTSMEFIGSMHLPDAGIATLEETALLRRAHLEHMILWLLPSVARGDAFQHWAYENPELAQDPAQCDQKWQELTQRFLPEVDWSGLDAVLKTGWQNILHFHCYPFYYVEYGFAALGAIQVWANYLKDPQAAIQQYRHALSLGATRTIPELFAAAGAQFAFDAEAVQSALDLLLQNLEELEATASPQ
ncbi:M3 family oligoendopeptidase [Ktedonospora formicarum]|uniref:Oligoendopeptidase F n=1 Tax=Ktedonospora formicarum TaxID=2778364 RepID=A0A8J3I0Z5_9CHLR|nr:M3 family oligoendopeptidase [Ktedonospora formicarum]GHO46806.1 oligoendopeptidase F [Ktedonospora formicarum]